MRLLKPVPPIQQKQSDGMIKAQIQIFVQILPIYRLQKKEFSIFFSVRGQDFIKRTVNEAGCFLDLIKVHDQCKDDFNVYVIKKCKKCPRNKIM